MSDRPALLPALRAALPGLRPAEARVATAFLADPARSAALSMAQLAEAGGTSMATLARLSRRLGYDSFRELRVDLASEATREAIGTIGAELDTSDIDRDDPLDEVIQKITANETLSIADTASALDRDALRTAIDAVVAARRIDVFGVGASSVVRLDLEQKLGRIGLTAFGWEDANSAWTAASVLEDDCVAIVISHSGTTREVLRFLDLGARSGATTIALTNFPASPIGRTADVVLATAARENRFRSGALGSRIAQLMVVDCLFTGVVQATYERSISALKRSHDAMSTGRDA